MRTTTLLALLAGCCSALACGQKGLAFRGAEAGVPRSGSGQSEAGLADSDSPQGGKPDAALETKPDAAPETKPDSGAVGSRCIPASARPTSLGLLAGQRNDSLAVLGDKIYLAGSENGGEGHILVVTFGTHAQRIISLGPNLPVKLLARPEALYYVRGQLDRPSPGATSYTYTDVGRFDLATEQVSILPGPGEYTHPWIRSLLDAKGDILWEMGEDSPSSFSLVRWSSSTGKVETLVRRYFLSYPVVGGDTLYWQERTQSGLASWRSLPLGGGTVEDVVDWSRDVWPPPRLLALDETVFYYLGAPGIQAMPKNGGPGRTLVPDVGFAEYRTDGLHHYWLDETLRLFRAPMGGGEPEIVWDVDNHRYVGGFALDDCNIYWAVWNPGELFVRAK